MRLSKQWLYEWVNPALSTGQLVEQLTMAGLEIDGVETVAGKFSGVIVGEIVAIEQHPNADKLRVCQVNNGSDTVQVVCGAPNAKLGLKAPFAVVGACLPGDITIKKAKLRGVESFGMLCAGQELGLTEQSAGLLELPIDAQVGQDLYTALVLDDVTLALDLTPNRADCLSVAGIARELGVLNKMPVNTCTIEPVAAQTSDTFPVTVEDSMHCPRYLGRVIRNIDIHQPTPWWMQEKLRRCGLRSVDVVVDVTNYVLLELGQPLHAFDVNQLAQEIIVRPAKMGESIILLDGKQLTLQAGSLVIADQRGPVALAGVMGGQCTAVSASTCDIFLESAFFLPSAVTASVRCYGLHTDASHRFERGVDYQLPMRALERATALLLAIAGGQSGPLITVTNEEQLPPTNTVTLRRKQIAKILGVCIDDSEVVDIFNRLGMVVNAIDVGWQVTVPPWRFDIALEVDLLEELARIYGYNRLPVASIANPLVMRSDPSTTLSLEDIRWQLSSRGFHEIISYSFVSAQLQQMVCPDDAVLALLNPISSDLAVMRTSLWPGLLTAARYNFHRQQSRVRLFESGLTFIPREHKLPEQQLMLAGLVAGRRMPQSWSEQGEKADFYDLKGDLESVLALINYHGQWFFEPASHPALHPGQSASVALAGERVGYIGALHPEIQDKMELSQQVYLFHIDLSVVGAKKLPSFTELSKFPEVHRDLAVLVDKNVSAEMLLAVLRQVAIGSCLQKSKLFDIYQGAGIDPKKKSIALGLTFQHPSRTLRDDEVERIISDIVNILKQKLGAVIRDGQARTA